MSEILNNLNNIPVRTWRWLGVNETNIKDKMPEIKDYNLNPLIENNGEGYKVFDIKKNNSSIRFFDNKRDIGIADPLTDLVTKNFNSGYLIEVDENKKVQEPILIDYKMDTNNSVLVDNNFIIAGENSEITVVIKYSSNKGDEAFHSGLTKLYAKKGAVINLVKVQLMEDDGIHLDAIAAATEEEAEINCVLIELGAKSTVTSCKNDLLSKNSKANIYSIYLGDKDRSIDINYVINHYGRKSESNIKTNGALMDKSSKIFRGTIDFKRGSKESKGMEEEYAVLLSSGIRNRSVPLLLCAEDDVQGQHAASTGKIDENKLFYLMSRGFSELEAKKLIIESSFTPITEKVPIEELREEISEYIRRRMLNV
ncbi:FeS cluster assembly protein SufB [Clostridium sp. N3C]|uniref:Fe-S cluster assembly protein SufD n=1 Tax=Clostridium sp. N3C TaxID=1776758 RepID=UPI00092E0BC5|nr:Fe-S cluster assembly protein SufD [Clostridium sp. N3C]SCN23315.1 FeS cluster assembly protein SufB [Clostridium sp. N3C]